MRHIGNDKLKEYVTGAVYFKEDNDGLIPYRFSEEKLVSTKGNLRREIRHYGGIWRRNLTNSAAKHYL